MERAESYDANGDGELDVGELMKMITTMTVPNEGDLAAQIAK